MELDEPKRLAQAPSAGDLAFPAPKRRMLMIVNPYASTVSDRLRRLVVAALSGRYDVEAVDTQARGHATDLCRRAGEEGYDVVVAFGGDGTVNEAANGLLGSPTPLTCLPGGNANVFGKMLGIPGELIDATEHLLGLADRWQPRKVDVGVVNGRCFTFSSGLGIDASVVERVDSKPHLKARFGPWFYTWASVETFLRRYLTRPPRMTVQLGGQSLQGVTTVVQNGSPFTYFLNKPIEIADGTALDSGSLAGCVLHRTTPLTMPLIAWRAVSSRVAVTGHRQVTGLPSIVKMTVSSSDGRPLPLQVDGDFLGEVHEARYSLIPRALSVIS